MGGSQLMLRSLKKMMKILTKPLERNFEDFRTRDSKFNTTSNKGFTLVEIIVVIVILSIASAITVKFMIDSLRIYTMTVNQKTLLDEGKLALERMCRDIRDANSITGSTATSITFVRTHATGLGQDTANETITYRSTGGNLEKVKASTPYAIAGNVYAFTVTQGADNEITLLLTLRLGTGENVTVQTKVHPKNLPKSANYKNFFHNWQEELSS
jgi:prepilin-type N-terminal cleavage/methylation domain-containing protein